ncbi:MAG: right-handed parallel beta-helix repeat-containing protein [Acidobacteria bacterium]|nr:right-handed parallel beta-helix repeat-containing protein [Acidobacteriota bacterium]MBV9478304.1 right-handed parallel beta-helix repeat-containing protein [Acidobacteriota bacterium]
MRSFKVAVAAVLFAVLSTATAHAATYYVATSGNDANAGSLAAPFKTVTRASYAVKPGDTVQVRGGIYSERVMIGSKGTATARITFQPYPNEKVIFDGANVGTGNNVVTVSEAAFVTLGGFEIRNGVSIGLCSYGSHDVTLINNTVHDNFRNGIYVGAEGFGQSYNNSVDSNTVYHNVIENQAHNWNGGWATGVSLVRTNDSRVTNNTIYENDGEGVVTILAQNDLVQNNTIRDNFSVGVYVDNSRFITTNANLIYSTGLSRYFRDGMPACGFGTANEVYDSSLPSSDNTWTNNIVVNTRWGFFYGAYDNGGGLKNAVVANNTFYKSAQQMIWIAQDAHANNLFVNNVFYQNGGVNTPNIEGAGTTFKNNAWYGGIAGVAAGIGDVLLNPGFVNPGGVTAADYKLTSTSPLIGRGADVATVTNDYFGVARTSSYDIGAQEFSSASAPAPVAPSVPVNVTGSASGTTVTINWSASTGSVKNYTMYRNGVALGTTASTTWVDTGLASAATYSYAVSAIGTNGLESARSATVAVATVASAPNPGTGDVQAPTIPLPFSPAAVTTTSISLSWGKSFDNVGIAAYVLYRNGVQIARITTQSYVDTGLLSGTRYTYALEAVDGSGNTSPRASTYGTTKTAAAKRRAS